MSVRLPVVQCSFLEELVETFDFLHEVRVSFDFKVSGPDFLKINLV